MPLPPALAAVMVAFRPLFAKPVFERALLLTAGMLLAVRIRTVTAALRAMGLDQAPGFSAYHRVLSRARWSALAAGRILLGLLVERFAPDPSQPLVFGIDDTIERRWGSRIAARGIYRDPVRSSRGHFVKASGLRWLSVMLLTDIRWARRIWALPVLTALCPSERYYAGGPRSPKKLTEWARQLVLQLARWLPDRRLVIVTDSSFSAIELLAAVRERVTVVTRLRLDAALYAAAPPRRPGQVGRPRKKGGRLPALAAVLTGGETRWQRLVVSRWYGETERVIEVTTGTAVWYHSGMPVVPLRWVLVRDPAGALDPKALLSTDLAAAPIEVVSWFVRRWSVEVTFEEARRHLGVETQRQWSAPAIARTTPCLLGLFSVVTLAADRLDRTGGLVTRQSAWYRKGAPTFSDAVAAVRQVLWRQEGLSTSRAGPGRVEIPEPLFERLTSALAYAA